VTPRERWDIAWRTARWARVGSGKLHHPVEVIAAMGSGLRRPNRHADDRAFPMPVHTVSLRETHPTFLYRDRAVRQQALALRVPR
jgi:hypothetical protein